MVGYLLAGVGLAAASAIWVAVQKAADTLDREHCGDCRACAGPVDVVVAASCHRT